MGKKGTCLGVRGSVWILLAVLAIQNATAATSVWTAVLEIIIMNSTTGQMVSKICNCGFYGLDSPIRGVQGQVMLPELSSTACGPQAWKNFSVSPWIAIVERGNCTFTQKINVARKAGAAAVVIYNVPGTGYNISPMLHPGTGDTVAIMIGYLQGMEIVDLIKSNIPVTMSIQVGKQHGPWMSHYSVFFVSISFFVVTAATVGYFIFYSARRLNSVRLQNKKQKRLKAEAKKAIGQLQVRTLKQGDQEIGSDADMCAVCIDAYKPGDVVSILTCNHFFHKSCIEPWLLEHRTCPMCKCDILKVLGVEPDIEEATHAEVSVADFRMYQSSQEDTRSETASSGYASVQGAEDHSLPAEESPHQEQEQSTEGGEVQINIQPHYDNMAFEGDSQNREDPCT